MFLGRNKKNNVYPCKPQFYHIKVGLLGSKLYRCVFVMLSKFICYQSCIKCEFALQGCYLLYGLANVDLGLLKCAGRVRICFFVLFFFFLCILNARDHVFDEVIQLEFEKESLCRLGKKLVSVFEEVLFMSFQLTSIFSFCSNVGCIWLRVIFFRVFSVNRNGLSTKSNSDLINMRNNKSVPYYIFGIQSHRCCNYSPITVK